MHHDNNEALLDWYITSQVYSAEHIWSHIVSQTLKIWKLSIQHENLIAQKYIWIDYRMMS